MRNLAIHDRLLTAAAVLAIFSVSLPVALEVAASSLIQAESAEVENKDSGERVEVDDISDVVGVFNPKVAVQDAGGFCLQVQIQHDAQTVRSNCSTTSRGPPVA